MIPNAFVDRVKTLVWGRRLGRFAIVGLLNTIFGFLAFPIFYYGLYPFGDHYMVALTLSYLASISFSYFTNKVLVFRSQERSFIEFLRFSSFYIFYFAVNAAVLPFSVEVLHIAPVIAQMAMVLAIVITSYVWHASVTFRQRGIASTHTDVPE